MARGRASTPRRIVVGISGASGVQYGIRMLEVLREIPDVETHFVMTQAAGQTIVLETDTTPRAVAALADVRYKINDIAATLSSGSFLFESMIVIPCSMKTAAAIAWGFDDNLLTRAADVALKERRQLIVCARETPLHLGHLRTLAQLADIGAIVAPLMPGFYSRPKTVADIVDHEIGRLLDLLQIAPPEGMLTRWKGPSSDPTSVDSDNGD